MKLIKVAAVVLNQTPLDWSRNCDNIINSIAAARAAGASVVCLPEMCIAGYGCEDAFLSPGVQRTAVRLLRELLAETRGLVVSFGLPVLYNKALFNTACLAVDGRLLGFVAKRFLCGDGIHYEPRWFKPWPRNHHAHVQPFRDLGDDASFPIGDVHFDVAGVKIGFEICEDAWVADRPGADLALRGVDVILNPSASHFAFGKAEVRERFTLEGSRVFGCAYVYANLLGNEAGRAIYEGGAMIASCGRMVARGPRFSMQDWIVTTAVVDIDANRMLQSRLTSFEPSVDDPGSCVSTPFEFPDVPVEPPHAERARWERGEWAKEEEFTRAISLALFDYLRKSRSHGFVVSLSGGADSAAVSCLVALMALVAQRELGPHGFAARLGLKGPSAHNGPARPAAGLPVAGLDSLLTCVYQSTRNSSQRTREAARTLAEGLGAEFVTFDVDALVESYVGLASKAVSRALSWERDDVALQNIQARVRAPGVWLLANLRNALLLSTSNRSEAAVGYATMDGDTSGGLCPIGGIDKAFLQRWLLWLQKHGPDEVGPIAALADVTAQTPTAELRPPERSQTDEADLMPYELLDAIERAAIRDRQMPVEVFRLLAPRFGQHEPRQLAAWIERFFTLWARNQWKRERYAPSFHVDDENLDPKTWCRFPILSGGFEQELADLRAFVDRVAGEPKNARGAERRGRNGEQRRQTGRGVVARKR